ncbi:unnamed protein product [Adineta steineri]|uniref:FAS1 domain-containing protein n=2 Tax=Adineta steineri TaxID=433720 RepID=A0A813TT90_9BILA|nr:unnamed protein product [Adineta steineri]
MNLIHSYILFIIINICYSGPIEDISAMPDLTLFYQQLIRQPELQGLLQDAYQSAQPLVTGDFTIFAPNNDAMTRINRRNEDPTLLWKYHIVPGRFDDQTIYNMAQDKFNQANPRQMADNRPQNNLPTMALPFQVFYGLGFYGGTGPYINVSYDNSGYSSSGIPWSAQTSLNLTNRFDNSVPLSPYLGNTNNYSPNQQTQNYVVAQGSASSGNPNLFPQNLTNYYTNVFNPNVNTQFLQNANPPNTNINPNLQQQQQQQLYAQGNYAGIGILRPTINSAFILQSRPMSRGIINVIDNILWPPERRDQTQYKTAYDALEDTQFSRLRLLADRSDYFRSELRSMHHQTWFLPNDQAFTSFGSSLNFLFEPTSPENTHDINDFIKSHIVPIVLYPCAMDASKQLSTLSLGKWVTFRRIGQADQTFQIDVVSNRQVAHIVTTRSEDIKIYGNGVVYPITTILSGPARSAADELARSYQYFMALIQQSGDTELVNILQGSTSGLGNTGPSIYNPQNLLNITVLIPQQIHVQQLGNSQELSKNLRRHILRFPVYIDQMAAMTNTIVPQQPFIQTGVPIQQYQRSGAVQNKNPSRQRRRRRQLNSQHNVNFQQHQVLPSQPILPNQRQQQQNLPMQQRQQQIQPKQQLLPNQQQQPLPNQHFPPNQQHQQQIQPNQQFSPNQQHQQQIQPKQQLLPNQQQQILPNQQFLPNQQQQILPNQQFLPNQQQQFLPNQQQQILPDQQLSLQQQQILPNQQQQILPIQQQQQQQILPSQQLALAQQQLNPVLNPSYYQLPNFPTSGMFQNGQTYPTMDPTFSVQAQVTAGPNGNVVTLIGRPDNSIPFTATVLNTESNIPIKNGVMHVIRGILSGAVIPLDTVLTTMQGASSFTQLLQQTGVIDQLKQSGRPYTLFIPTNTALQSIGVTNDINRIRQFVLRHVCADVILDPMANIVSSSGGYLRQNNMAQGPRQPPIRRNRRKRQDWADTWRNGTISLGGQGYKAPDLGPGYFQPQQQVYGGYPAAPSPFSTYNQLYNPGYVMSGYANPNSQYFPGYNGTYAGFEQINYPTLDVPGQPMLNTVWNQTFGSSYNPQINVVPINGVPINGVPSGGGQSYYTGVGGFYSGSNYVPGPQSCMAMTGERITVQPIASAPAGGVNPTMSYQNFMVTCCGDQSVNAMVQAFNVYPPSYAVYVIGRSLLSTGQTINTMYNHSTAIFPYHFLLFILITLLIFIKHL